MQFSEESVANIAKILKILWFFEYRNISKVIIFSTTKYIDIENNISDTSCHHYTQSFITIATTSCSHIVSGTVGQKSRRSGSCNFFNIHRKFPTKALKISSLVPKLWLWAPHLAFLADSFPTRKFSDDLSTAHNLERQLLLRHNATVYRDMQQNRQI